MDTNNEQGNEVIKGNFEIIPTYTLELKSIKSKIALFVQIPTWGKFWTGRKNSSNNNGSSIFQFKYFRKYSQCNW